MKKYIEILCVINRKKRDKRKNKNLKKNKISKKRKKINELNNN